MSSRKQREKLRERRMEFDRSVEESRKVIIAAPKEEPKEEPNEEKKPAKKRGRPNKKKESK